MKGCKMSITGKTFRTPSDQFQFLDGAEPMKLFCCLAIFKGCLIQQTSCFKKTKIIQNHQSHP
jgi:hypothetical protein